MNGNQSKRQCPHVAFDDAKPRWYHYALRRLPLSLLVSLLTLFVLVPVLVFLVVLVYGWLVG